VGDAGLNIAILSAFRNATGYIARYCEQMDRLQKQLYAKDHMLTLVLGHGDSSDGTEAMIFEECSNRFCAHLMDVSHGGPSFGSIEDRQRFKQCAYVGNALLAAIPAQADIIAYVESDLLWQAPILMQLLADLKHFPVIAPMVMHTRNPGLYRGNGPFFYDCFAFRRRGVRFANEPPYHADLIWAGDDLLELDSAGSMLVMWAELARQARFSDDEAIVGLCRQIRELGAGIWLDRKAIVYHP
jgi:hypothetical protein